MTTWVLEMEKKTKKGASVERVFLMESLGHNALTVRKVAAKHAKTGDVRVTGPEFGEAA